jgi:hypothetical protein
VPKKEVKMKKTLAAALVIAALGLPTVGSAQFGSLLNAVKPGGGGGSASADLGGQQTQLVRNYTAAGKDVLTANGQMTEALGIKHQMIDDSAKSDSMSASDIEAQDKAISADAQALSDAYKSGATLKDSAAKAKYAQGLVALVSGVRKYAGMRSDVQNFSSGLSSVSPLQLGNLQSGIYVAKSVPTSLTNLTTVLKSAIDFAKSNGVAVPADATSIL